MLVEATVDFLDIRENKNRKKGEQFECTEERYEQLLHTDFGKLVKSLEKKAAPQKRAAKTTKQEPKKADEEK